MAVKFFKTIFGSSGDITNVPDAVQVDGSVSYAQGYGPDYQRIDTDPLVKYPERDKFNDILYNVTAVLNQFQTQAFPDFITSADNGGTPYPYAANAFVRYGGQVYQSLVNSNTDTPPTANWQLFAIPQAFSTGDVKEIDSSTLPSGWIWANGRTIGDASSNATNRANADTYDYFVKIWTEFPDAVRPIYTSAGVLSSRGASAAADWAAHKAITVLNKCGRVSAGWTIMGGASPGTLTGNTTQGVDGSILGNMGGEQSHSMIAAENGQHSHDSNPPAGYPSGFMTPARSQLAAGQGPGAQLWDIAVYTSTATSGTGTPHCNVQPTVITGFIVKL